MTSILVPVDFSETSLKAALFAAEISRKSNAVLCLLHCANLGHEYIHQPFPLHEKYNELVKEERHEELLEFAKNISEAYTYIKVEIALIKSNVVDGIIEFCNAGAFDLIVMGTKGSSGIKEVIAGSTTAHVIAKSRVPVLAVPDAFVLKEPNALLFATNRYEREISLLRLITEMAAFFSAKVYVVVFEDIDTISTNTNYYNTEQVQQYLQFLKNTFPGISFRGQIIQGTGFEGAIEQYCISNDVDIIAMISYPKTYLDRIMNKSTTQKMTFHSRIPILAIPAICK